MLGHAVMCEQEVQERAENAPLWGPCVEDQRNGGVVSYLHLLGATRQEVQDPASQGAMMSLEGTMVLNAELLSMKSILT